MLSHLNKHVCNLKLQIKIHYDIDTLLALSVSEIRYKLLEKHLLSSLYQERLTSFNTKKKKIKGLISKNKGAESNYSTHLKKFSYIELTSDQENQFKFSLEYSFIDKNKHIKKLNRWLIRLQKASKIVNAKISTSCYVHTWTFLPKNIYATRDNTYKNLKRIVNDQNFAVVSGDKESCVVIMNRSDYF